MTGFRCTEEELDWFMEFKARFGDLIDEQEEAGDLREGARKAHDLVDEWEDISSFLPPDLRVGKGPGRGAPDKPGRSAPGAVRAFLSRRGANWSGSSRSWVRSLAPCCGRGDRSLRASTLLEIVSLEYFTTF